MPALRCTVRDCLSPLAASGATLRCDNGHAFDRAREGYWNLLQPQDRKASKAGDPDDVVDARRAWLARGYAGGFVRAIGALIDRVRLPPGATAIDVGCGEGSLTVRLLGSRNLDVSGIDLSTRAVRLAAKSDPSITWIVANADRGLPFGDGTVAAALSIFGRRPASELHRVLDARGTLIVAVPAADDLIELRAAVSGEGRLRDRREDTRSSLDRHFEPVSSSVWRETFRHDGGALIEAATMSYRGARRLENRRLTALREMDVTLAADILLLVPRRSVR